jgi:hypothetical protein
MISHKHKFIFVHIPKTGGTSIERIFIPTAGKKDVPRKHDTLKMYENDFLFFEKYFKFSFVRNPWDLTISMYNYLWYSSEDWPRTWRKRNAETSELSFSDWVKHIIFRSPSIRSIDVGNRGGSDGNQIDWISCEKNLINFIGRFENLQEDFNIVCDKIGIPQQELPHKNKTKHKHYTEYYDNETRQIVAEKYAKDIEYFGYEFGK